MDPLPMSAGLSWQAVAVFAGVVLFVLGAALSVIGYFGRQLLVQLRAQHAELKALLKAESVRITEVDRKVMDLRAELPEKYVRRDDYVRVQAIIDARLDSIYTKLVSFERGLGWAQGKESGS